MSKAVCPLCLHHCALEEGEVGICRARIGRRGGVEPLYYGKLSALALDRVEKKPLRRFCPGRMVLSLGSFGCNLRCPFCQNHRIAQPDGAPVHWQEWTPQALARRIRRLPREDAAKIPILAVTANAFAEDIAATTKAGMNAHISKPIDFSVLCDTLSSFLPG